MIFCQNYIESAMPVLRPLTDAGHQAYLVGGCVREALRCSDVFTDIDIATDADPEKVREIFHMWQVIDTGLSHGTVTVLMPSSGGNSIPVEVTTFRTDGSYSDGRHPDKVEFVGSIEEDLARRDFTVNAMALSPGGRIVDPFGGMRDLEKGLIRAVGDPGTRFREDGLRIIRAIRFASVLDFEIEDETGKALLLHRQLLDNIARERIFSELKKTLAGESAGRVLRQYPLLIETVIPELKTIRGFDQRNPYHRYDILEHSIRAMEAVETTPENRQYMKMMALLHDIGKPTTFTIDEDGVGHFYGHAREGDTICRTILDRLKADRAVRDRICYLVHYHDLVFQEDDRILKRWMGKHGVDVLLEILAFKKADNIATGNATQELLNKFDRIRDRILDIQRRGECFTKKDLAIDGNDLIEIGIISGPGLGHMLDLLLEQVLDGNVENERDALVSLARSLYF